MSLDFEADEGKKQGFCKNGLMKLTFLLTKRMQLNSQETFIKII